MRFTLISIIAFFLWTCKTPEHLQPTLLQLSDHQKIIFLDSTNAATAIISDTIEHYFEKVNSLDMSIQLKRKIDSLTERDILLADYKIALQKDVLNFTPEEISFITSIFQNIFKDCNSLSKNIFPSEIKLVKIRGSHYGNSAFYTRENCIIIPESEINELDETSFRKTMLHELFHIYSRLNLQKKQTLYKLIGFKSTGGTQLLQMDKALKEIIILNPDGIDYAYAIQLRAKDKSLFNAIPLIISNENDFVEGKQAFFDYLKFGLYKIIPPFSRMIKVVSNSNGESTINFEKHPEFFEQITDNTDYIIHPDELMADNFVIAIQSLNDSTVLKQLSEPGRFLINETLEIIKD